MSRKIGQQRIFKIRYERTVTIAAPTEEEAAQKLPENAEILDIWDITDEDPLGGDSIDD